MTESIQTSYRYVAVWDTNIRCQHLTAVWDTNIRCYKNNWSTSKNGTGLKVVGITTETFVV